jgi:hypothetical protein
MTYAPVDTVAKTKWHVHQKKTVELDIITEWSVIFFIASTAPRASFLIQNRLTTCKPNLHSGIWGKT